MKRLIFAAALLMLVGLAPRAVSAQDASPTADGAAASSLLAGLGYPDLVVTSDGTTNDLPASLAAGRYHVVLHNTNATNNVDLDFFMAPAGTSQADALAFYSQAVGAGEGPVPDLFYKVTIPGGLVAPPNGSVDGIIDFKPGDGDWYAGLQIESNDNGPGQGQAQPLTLTGDFPSVTDPTATITVSLADFMIGLPDSVGTGPQIWKVTNTGLTPHFVEVGMSDGSLTQENVQATFGSFIGTPMPASATPIPFESIHDVVQTGVLSPGQSMWVAVDLQPGQYVAACFLSGPGDEPMHAAMGMFKLFNAA